MEKLYVIKIGGAVIDNKETLKAFLSHFAAIKEKKILIHGGGKLATELATTLNIPQRMVDGRRITDTETLKIATMVYAGYINKTVVAQLQGIGCNAVGLSGADGNVIRAHKRKDTPFDFGWVGDIDKVNNDFIEAFLNKNIAVVLAPITHDKMGQLLNTNADTIAQEVAKSFSGRYAVHLVFSFEKNGVLLQVEDESSVINELTLCKYNKLKEEGTIFAGMIPKLDNAFHALQNGVDKITIGKAEHLLKLIMGGSGTTIKNE